MSRKTAWIILYIFQLFHVVCRGYLWNVYLYLNEAPSEDISLANLESTFIKNLHIIKASANSLTLSWNTKHKNLTSYLVEWHALDELTAKNASKIFFSKNKFEFTIESLKPCTVYNITVTPETAFKIEAAGKSITGETTLAQENVLWNIITYPGKIDKKLTLNVSWEVILTVESTCIKYYEVIAETIVHNVKHVVKQKSINKNVVLSDLCACASYWITVEIIDRSGSRVSSSPIQSRPTWDEIGFSPKLIDTISTKSSITLNWNILIDPKNNCSIHGIMARCIYSCTHGYGFKIKRVGSSIRSIKKENSRAIALRIHDLSPFSEYQCYGRTINSAGVSYFSNLHAVYTAEDVPSAPENFRYIWNTRIMFKWDYPKSMPGHLQKYKLTILWKPLYPVPSYCKIERTVTLDNIDSDSKSYTWKGGEGYSEYTAYVEAKTTVDWGSKSKTTFSIIYNGVSDKVTNFYVETRPQKNNLNALETVLFWNLPCSLKGRLSYFQITVFGIKPGSENHTMNKVMPIEDLRNIREDANFSYNLGELRPQYKYRFGVSAFIEGVSKGGQIATQYSRYPPGIPPEPNLNYMLIIVLDPEKTKRTSTSVELLLPLFQDTNGHIKYYAILVSRAGFMDEARRIRFDTSNGNWPNISSWRESMENDFKLTYQATKQKWSPYPNYILNYGNIQAVKIIIGDDVTCKHVSTIANSRTYCNGPLKPDTWYEVRMRAFTAEGFADSMALAIRTDAEMKIDIVIGIVIGIVLVGIATSLWLIKKSRRKW